MDIHLDPLGGWSGDMFVAALLDAFPEYWPRVQSTIASLNLGAEAECRLAPHRDDAFTGSRFLVAGDTTASEQPSGSRQRADSHGDPSHPHDGHRAWADIRAELNRSGLDVDVKKHAVAIFELLAEAEAKVHGVEVESVTFHEVGAVDSIIDIVAAAQLISLIRADRWTSAPLPIGSGRINSAHGVLPVPAPAAALLMQGLPVMDDGVPGERVTPTGAALAAYLIDPPRESVRAFASCPAAASDLAVELCRASAIVCGRWRSMKRRLWRLRRSQALSIVGNWPSSHLRSTINARRIWQPDSTISVRCKGFST